MIDRTPPLGLPAAAQAGPAQKLRQADQLFLAGKDGLTHRRFSDALRCFRGAIEIYESLGPAARRPLAGALIHAARALDGERNYLAEIALRETAIAIYRGLGDPCWVKACEGPLIDARAKYGSQCLAAGEIAAGEAVLAEVITICRTVGTRNEHYVRTFNIIVRAYCEAGFRLAEHRSSTAEGLRLLRECAKLALEAAAWYGTLRGTKDEAYNLKRAGMALARVGRLTKNPDLQVAGAGHLITASQLFEETGSLIDAANLSTDAGKALIRAGLAGRDKTFLDSGEQCLEKALTLFQRGHNRQGMGYTLLAIGWAYVDVGRLFNDPQIVNRGVSKMEEAVALFRQEPPLTADAARVASHLARARRTVTS